MNQQITITVELANAVLQYLAGRPYGEVVNLISEMQKQAQQSQQAQQPVADE